MMKEMLSSTPSTSVERSSPAVAVELNEQVVDTELPCVQETEDITEATESPVRGDNNTHEIVSETPAGAERPPSPPMCNKCSRLSKNLRRVQKDNSYLRKRNRQLKYQLKAVRNYCWVFCALLIC